jgi:hypothetical protein
VQSRFGWFILTYAHGHGTTEPEASSRAQRRASRVAVSRLAHGHGTREPEASLRPQRRASRIAVSRLAQGHGTTEPVASSRPQRRASKVLAGRAMPRVAESKKLLMMTENFMVMRREVGDCMM